MDSFDIIIGGGGISGLTLAYYLNNSSFHKKKIAIIDGNLNKKDNYISFWTKDTYFFDSLIKKSWNTIQISFSDYERQYALNSYTYKLINTREYKEFIIKQLSENPNITFIRDILLDYSINNNSLEVITKNKTYQTQLLFDSTYHTQQTQSYDHLLYMHAFTQEIIIPNKTFNSEVMTFLDFRTKDGSTFCYCLPISKNHAVFQLTNISSQNAGTKNNYKKELAEYLSKIQKLHSYEIINEQYGVIPLTDKKFNRYANEFVINIGLNGGQIKPSTGFGFTRILKDSKAIVDSLEKNNNTFSIKQTPFYYSFFDSLFLEVINSKPQSLEQIFKEMFLSSKNIENIFTFLDEESSLIEIINIIKKNNYSSFIKALLSKNIYKKFVH